MLSLILFCFSLLALPVNSYAADSNNSSNACLRANKAGTTAYFKFPDWLRFWQQRHSPNLTGLAEPGLLVEPFCMEYYKWEFRSKHSTRFIEVIHDYDDYTHIMRTYETKE